MTKTKPPPKKKVPEDPKMQAVISDISQGKTKSEILRTRQCGSKLFELAKIKITQKNYKGFDNMNSKLNT